MSPSKHVRWAESNQTYSPAVIPRTPSPSWSDESLPESSAPYTPPSAFTYASLPPHTTLTPHPILAYNAQGTFSSTRYDLAQRPIHAILNASHHTLSTSELSQPATYPPVAYMEVRVPSLPWRAVQIAALNPRVGVTVGEALDVVYRYLRLPVSAAEYAQFPHALQPSISMAFSRRCKLMGAGERDTEMRKGLKRVDCLAGNTHFSGISRAGKDAYSWQLHVSLTQR